MTVDRYCIADGYHARERPEHHNDIGFTDDYQLEVYELARELMRTEHMRTVLDVGCGSGYKLVKYLGEFETVGVETEPCLSYLRRSYPTREWLESGEPGRGFGKPVATSFDLVMCSDVIEHLVDPDALISFVKSIESRYVLFSTPDREVLARHEKWNAPALGPPLNPAHVREWTSDELRQYLGLHFRVLQSGHCSVQIECQYHLCAGSSGSAGGD